MKVFVRRDSCGYTFIELLVVISVSSLLFFAVLVAYQRFNKGQALQSGALEVKALLRDAQNRALSGEKVEGGTYCTGTTTFLKGWYLTWSNPTNKTYSIYGFCTNAAGNDDSDQFGIKSFTLSSTDNIRFTNTGIIQFRPFHQGVDLRDVPAGGRDSTDFTNRAAICLRGDSSAVNFYKVTVSVSGEVNVQATSTCP